MPTHIWMLTLDLGVSVLNKAKGLNNPLAAVKRLFTQQETHFGLKINNFSQLSVCQRQEDITIIRIHPLRTMIIHSNLYGWLVKNQSVSWHPPQWGLKSYKFCKPHEAWDTIWTNELSHGGRWLLEMSWGTAEEVEKRSLPPVLWFQCFKSTWWCLRLLSVRSRLLQQQLLWKHFTSAVITFLHSNLLETVI